jgi:hypothetical protein
MRKWKKIVALALAAALMGGLGTPSGAEEGEKTVANGAETWYTMDTEEGVTEPAGEMVRAPVYLAAESGGEASTQADETPDGRWKRLWTFGVQRIDHLHDTGALRTADVLWINVALDANVRYVEAVPQSAGVNVKWSSSDSKVATVKKWGATANNARQKIVCVGQGVAAVRAGTGIFYLFAKRVYINSYEPRAKTTKYVKAAGTTFRRAPAAVGVFFRDVYNKTAEHGTNFAVSVVGRMTVGGTEWYVCDMGTAEGYYWVKASAVQDAKVSETTTATTTAATTTPTTTQPPSTTLDIRWPTPSYHGLSDSWGWRYNSYDGTIGFHRGIDIPAGLGTTVVAIMDGVVKVVDYDQHFGNYIKIQHDVPSKGTYYTYYFHLSVQSVSVNQAVKPGQKIGEVGTSGDSTGYHLHFEFMHGNDRTNLTINTTNSYADKDTRHGTSPNPQPLYRNYAYNTNFVWNYSESPLPSWYSHSSTYCK